MGDVFYSITYKSTGIVVTIKPIYGLVFALTNGITTPTLLCEGRGSTHTLNLVPSDYTLLKSADLVVWVGEYMKKRWQNHL